MYIQNQFSCFLIGEGTLPIQCAELLLERGHKILGVISSDASISSWAKRKDIPHIQPTDNLVAFLSQQPFDYLFSIVNNSVLPKEILELPRIEAINYHDALLPRYAGVNATSWALMHGEKTHGVTWHVMSAMVDAGNILKQISVEITSDETAFTLNGKCYEAAICSFAQLIDELSSNQALVRKPNLDERTYFGRYKRPRAGGVLSFNCCAHDIDAFVRALDFGPYPNPLGLPKLVIGNNSIVVSKLEVLGDGPKSPPGTVTAIESSFLKVSTADYSVALRQVLTMGGQVLPIPDLVARFGLQVGYQFKDIEPDRVGRIERFDALIAKHEAFWVERLKTLQPITIPYAQRTVSHLKSKQYASVEIPISLEITTFLEKRHPAWNLGEFLEAAFTTYLARIGGTECFDIGFRDVKLQQEMVGLENLFASHVPCRVNIGYEQSFEEVFEAFKKQVELTKLHLTYGRDVVCRYPALRSLSQTECGQMFPVVVERVEKLDNYQAEPGNELTLVIASYGKECFWFYNTSALDGDSIGRMQDQFTIFLRGIVTDPACCVTEIPLLSDPERHKILVEWNDTQADYPKDKCIHQLFEAIVEQTPDAVAVVFEEQQLTYKELNQRANQLAHHLRNLGVGAEVLVGLCVERSLEMVVGLLGILKAGGAYVPLDPAYPPERLAFMLEDSQVGVLLTQARLVESIPKYQGRIVCLDTDWEIIERQSEENPKCSFTPENLAYVIYTSGSTGRPKGVLVAHRGLCNLAKAQIEIFDVNLSSRVLQFASLSFDVATSDWVIALCSGATLCIASNNALLAGSGLIELLRDRAITDIELPAAVLRVLPLEELPTLGTIIVGGEAVSADLVAKWSSGRRFFNAYGPTESTVCATIAECSDSSESPPIGRPIANIQVYILDAQLQAVPIGIPGELYIGGAGLARGYLNRPELTAERFILNPFSDEPSSRLYKTGDLARYLSDGNIEFLGRIDQQVKIRGFRIELGEIEAVLSQHPDVRESVVMKREDAWGNQRLVAYIVSNLTPERTPFKSECLAEFDGNPAVKLRTEDISLGGVGLLGVPDTCGPGQTVRLCLHLPECDRDLWLEGTVAWCRRNQAGIELALGAIEQDIFQHTIEYLLETHGFLKVLQRTAVGSLRNLLQQKLPNYMMPSSFVFLKALPLTPNGKIDRKALPQPDSFNAQLDYVAPQTEIEEAIATAWQQVLHPAKVGVDDNLWDIELGEIQAVLSQHPDVRECVVMKREDASGNQCLVAAYIVSNLIPERTPFKSDCLAEFDGNPAVKLRTEDMSLAGVGLVGVPDTCEPGQTVRLRMHLPGSGEERWLAGRVTWCRGNQAGIEFALGAREQDIFQHSIAYLLETQGFWKFLQRTAVGSLRNVLQQKLPNYMVPSSFVFLNHFPLTPNGKVDLLALPVPDALNPQLETTYVAPQTELEQIIATVWQQVLHLEKVGVEDSFFALGGNSLLIAQAQSKLREVVDREVSISEIFKYPTISSLAKYLSEEPEEKSSLGQSQERVKKQKDAINRQKQKQRSQGKKKNV